MTLNEVREILKAQVHCCEDRMETEVHSACGSDLMSDVLAYVKDQGLLLTGLNNPQVVRTAEMMDVICIVFVRGKRPDPAVVELAQSKGIVIMTTDHPLFSSCGLLYSKGLRGGVADHG